MVRCFSKGPSLATTPTSSSTTASKQAQPHSQHEPIDARVAHMLQPRALLGHQLRRCRPYSHLTTTACATNIHPIPHLPDPTLHTFRTHAFIPALPHLLPQGTFNTLPAITEWFIHPANSKPVLNNLYLSRYGSTLVPLELSTDDHFTRTEQSLSFFLECVKASTSTSTRPPNRYFSAYVPGARAVRKSKAKSKVDKSGVDDDFFSASAVTTTTTTAGTSPPETKTKTAKARVYLAQAPISDLPQALRDDLPAPEIVLSAGKGDIYSSSIWLGEAPTFTPLHRDPNPNLFVQLAGKKLVRLFHPDAGRAIFAKVQEKIGASASIAMRGEDMMMGEEKRELEAEVWNDERVEENGMTVWEAELETGDGLFIPKGWWHSVKGIGSGMTGSVNWWFR